MEKYQIFVAVPTDDRQKALLESKAPGSDFHYVYGEKLTKSQVQEADIIIGNISPLMIKGSEKLKWVQLNSAGADGYTIPGILPKEAVLTNASGAYGLAISEHMIATLFCVMKKLHLYGKNQSQHIWKDEGGVSSIYGSKTLIVGYGNIGEEFGKRMHALGSSVSGIRRNSGEKPDYVEKMCQMDQLMDCLKDADIVANCLPRTKDTVGIFGEAAFQAMKPGAFFLNVGRGATVDSIALAEALNSGHLAGASVDVTDPEPLPAGHQLWDAENLLITPHVSGGLHLQETHERIIKIAAANLERFMRGEALCNVVDFETGYRKFGTAILLD